MGFAVFKTRPTSQEVTKPVFYSRPAANEEPRHEPRERWPRGSPCAKPQVEVAGEPGDPIVLEIDCLEGRRHLPIIRTRLAA